MHLTSSGTPPPTAAGLAASRLACALGVKWTPMAHVWSGNEIKGYSAEVKPGGEQWFGLIVEPIGDDQWSWAVICMAPLATVGSHVDANTPQPTSALAKAAAEGVLNEFLST